MKVYVPVSRFSVRFPLFKFLKRTGMQGVAMEGRKYKNREGIECRIESEGAEEVRGEG